MIRITHLGYKVELLDSGGNSEVLANITNREDDEDWLIHLVRFISPEKRDKIVIACLSIIINTTDYINNLVVLGYGSDTPSDNLNSFIVDNGIDVHIVEE